MEFINNLFKINKNKHKIKKNYCFYCGNVLEGSKRHFCSVVCNDKYWRGVYSKKWREGDFIVNIKDKPTEEELISTNKKYKARKIAYLKLKAGEEVRCQLCKIKLKNSTKVQRHHEDYDRPEIFMILCHRCHGLVRKYKKLKEMLYDN